MTRAELAPAERPAVVVGGGGCHRAGRVRAVGRASGIRCWRSTCAVGPTSSSAMSATKRRCGERFAVVRERVGVPLDRSCTPPASRAGRRRGRGPGDVAADPRGQPDIGLPVRPRGRRRDAAGRVGDGSSSSRRSTAASAARRCRARRTPTSKGGLLTLARFLAREHATDGITATPSHPGRTTRRCGRRSTPSCATASCRCSRAVTGARATRRPRGHDRPPVQRRGPLHHRRHDRRQRRPVDGLSSSRGRPRPDQACAWRRAWETSPASVANSGS